MDRSINPGDDFFQFANGRWFQSRTFGPDETYVGARADLIAQRKQRIRQIVQAAAASPAADPTSRAVGNLYASYVDQPRIDSLGLTPLAPEFAKIRAISDLPGLFDLFAHAPQMGFSAPFSGSTFYDFHAPGWLRYTVTPGGLGLPSRDAYLDADPRSTSLRNAYKDYVRDMLTLAGEPDAAAKADRVLAVETRLAKAEWPTADQRNFLKTANSLSLAELAKTTPGFDWTPFLAASGVHGVDTVIVSQPSAMAPTLDVIRSTPIADWQAWAVFHLVAENAPYLADPVAKRAFAFEQRLSGQEAQSPRWQTGVDLVERFLGQAVGKLYVQRWFPESSKRMVAAMFVNIEAEMRARILAAKWMSDGTRTEALRKIDTLVVKIGYPSKWPDYSGLSFRPDDFYGNLRQARAFTWAQRMDLIRRPLDRDYWQTTPQSSGAAANPNLNEVTVPAGALEPPYFDPAADMAVNYGAIGGVLSHELSHMFDQLGRQMDATGKLRDWWAPMDASRYESIAHMVEQQFGGYEALPGVYVDGRFTLNENIADISGLGIAYGAWQRSLGGRQPPVRDGFTGAQRFFLGWAQMRAGKMRDETLRGVLKSDPHSPDMFRVNGVVRNIDAWYAAFGIGPGDKLYLPPDQRAKFW